jgi:hypothetical protein
MLGVLWVLSFEKNSDYGFDSLASEWESLTIKKTGLDLAVKAGY